MIEIIKGLPAHVLGVRAAGNVTKEELDNVLVAAMDELVGRTDAIYYLLHLDTDLTNWDIGAWLSDAKVGLKYYTKWKKIAVVSDKPVVNAFTDAFSLVVPGEAKGFTVAEMEQAKTWVSKKAG